MRTAIKRTLTVLIIAALSIGCGMTVEKICDSAERKSYPRMYMETVMQNSQAFGIPQNMIYAFIRTESNFDSSAKNTSEQGDRVGLMQLTAEECTRYSTQLGIYSDPGMRYDPETNIKLGSCKIAEFYNKYSDRRCIYAAFAVGSETVDEWLANSELSDEKGHLLTIPDPEVSAYVEKLESTFQMYVKLYG